MKKILTILLAALIIPISTAAFQAIEDIRPSSNQTGDATVVTGSGYFYGIVVNTDADSNPINVEGIYDNTSATGTRLIPRNWEITARSGSFGFGSRPVAFNNGITVDVTSAGLINYMVYYKCLTTCQ